MENLKQTIACNLSALRKKSQITQVQLAEKLNYSDKAISKWEKGDCVPNIYVLMQLADFYGVKIQDIVCQKKEIQPKKIKLSMRTLTMLFAGCFVWLIATVVFVILSFLPDVFREWLSFIVAIPASFFVVLIFSIIWKNRILTAITSSVFIWTTILAINLILNTYQIWLVYIIGAPLQVLIILWCVYMRIWNRLKD